MKYNSSMTVMLLVIALVLLAAQTRRRRKNAVIANHRLNNKNKENEKMKELAEKFVNKECLIYTVASENVTAKGIIREVGDKGILIEDNNGNIQAVNLEYVVRIQEWPRNAKGKKKTFFA